jgi:transcription-repair coupling factor (superfamily II helicase)
VLTAVTKAVRSLAQKSNAESNIYYSNSRALPYLISSILLDKKITVIVSSLSEAEVLHQDLIAIFGKSSAELMPPLGIYPLERISPSYKVMSRRLRVFSRISSRDPKLRAVIIPLEAALGKVARSSFNRSSLFIAENLYIDSSRILKWLVDEGYERHYEVIYPGQFSIRGSVLDVFCPLYDEPLRLDFFGDQNESLYFFSPDSQRSTHKVKEATLYPVREFKPDEKERKKINLLNQKHSWAKEICARFDHERYFDSMESIIPYVSDVTALDFSKDWMTCVIVNEPELISQYEDLKQKDGLNNELLFRTRGIENVESFYLDYSRFRSKANDAITIDLALAADKVNALQADGLNTIIYESAIEKLRELLQGGYKVMVFVSDEKSGKKLADDLNIAFIREANSNGSFVSIGRIRTTAIFESIKTAIIAENDLQKSRTKPMAVETKNYGSPNSFEDLKVGSYVVHKMYGIGIYKGIVNLEMAGTKSEYLQLDYKGSDKLWVPVDQIDSLVPYKGHDKPQLNKLGGSDWRNAKRAAKSEAAKIAVELIELYKLRHGAKTSPFNVDPVLMNQIKDTFYYLETKGQQKAISDVLNDMAESFPTDRLICGDVGFGKTEIAVRAAFCCAQNGRQTAILVPTTILAKQHFEVFKERFDGFGINVAMLSRFLNPKDTKRVYRELALGLIDVVIGTHKLLAKDTVFKNLGLLIVDEEQSFGVDHKESLKTRWPNLDVLTLSASPIPRTLELSLSGIRDITIIDTPPVNRQPIATYVGPFNQTIVLEAITRELLRGGQVFYLHNRIYDIYEVHHKLQNLLPQLKIGVAHARLSDAKLEQVIIDFLEKKYDVLLCTSIIESGIDIPNVNTLIVDRADLLGLGQLHQLRGRVGRGAQKAYAYILYPAGIHLSDKTLERLKAIGEETELGSGFRLAMKDLEIRGAGNFLGKSQSGHISGVGYELYMQLVSEAIDSAKSGKIKPEDFEVKIDIKQKAYIPETYIEVPEVRIEEYWKLFDARTKEDILEQKASLTDRFGPLPDPVKELIQVALIRLICKENGICEAIVRQKRTASGDTLSAQYELLLKFHKNAVDKLRSNSDSEIKVIDLANTANIVESVLRELKTSFADSAKSRRVSTT